MTTRNRRSRTLWHGSSSKGFTTSWWVPAVRQRKASFTLSTRSTAGRLPSGFSIGRRRRSFISGFLSPCKVMREAPDSRVLVVPDRSLGTNDCRGWIRRSLFQRLQEKHDDELLTLQFDRLRRERHGTVRDEDLDEQERSILLHDAKREISWKRLPEGRFYQFRMAFANTQAKGAFKIMEDDVSDALEADFVLPESAVKPGLKIPAVMYSII